MRGIILKTDCGAFIVLNLKRLNQATSYSSSTSLIKAAVITPITIVFLAFTPTEAFAQVVNGDFENQNPGPGSPVSTNAAFNPSGRCTTGSGAARYAPAPWSKQSTPDYHTEASIHFDTQIFARAALPGFDISPDGGCFQGFRSLSDTANEGIFQTMAIANANTAVEFIYNYTEYTRPGLARCSPQVEFRVDSNDDSNGTSIAFAPGLGQPGGPTTEGEWITDPTVSFVPADFGTVDGGTLDIYVGVVANGCSNTWAFVDGIELVMATAALEPELTLTKVADDNTDRVIGETITYTYMAANTGNVDISDITVTDVHNGAGTLGPITIGALTNTSGDSSDDAADNTVDVLAPGDSVTFEATYVVTEADALAGAAVTNTATVTGTPSAGVLTDPTASESVTIAPPNADLSITKTNTPGASGEVDQADDTLTSGATTTYTLTVTNNGPDGVTGAVVSDVVGSGLTCEGTDAVTMSGDGVPTGSLTIADLTGAGIALERLEDTEAAVLSYSCTVN